ncbi:ROK family protein [bacterium]|nr:ROK family protein [bacterium]
MINRIGIDLGGTKTEIMLTEEDPQNVLKRKRIATQQERGYEFIINQLFELINDYLQYCHQCPLIGIGIPGSINQKTGLVRNSNTICLNGKPLKSDLESRLNFSISVENDANCFALSEALLGAGKGKETVIGLIMGTGMGGGIVRNGKIWNGLHGIAGEFGHTSIDYNGRDCWCGEKGCLERYISGTAVEQQYEISSGKRLKLDAIYRQYEAGNDETARLVIDDLLNHFSRGIANINTAFDPDIIVIGGGVSNIPLLYTRGADQIRKQTFSDECFTPIVKNSLGDSSGIFGAALLPG